MDDLPVYAYPRDTVGSVPDHHNKASHNPFAGGGSCFPFAKEKKKKNATSMKHNEAKINKLRYACTSYFPSVSRLSLIHSFMKTFIMGGSLLRCQ